MTSTVQTVHYGCVVCGRRGQSCRQALCGNMILKVNCSQSAAGSTGSTGSLQRTT
jgi:hypothetical protein